MNNRILISHPTGNANVRAALSALLEAGGLKEFHTTVASSPGNVWDLLGKSRYGKEFNPEHMTGGCSRSRCSIPTGRSAGSRPAGSNCRG